MLYYVGVKEVSLMNYMFRHKVIKFQSSKNGYNYILGQHLLISCFLSPAHILIIYSTALVIIIVIDNLKYIIIFIYIGLLPWKISDVFENVSRCPSKCMKAYK